MKCPKCGANVPAGATSCGSCGSRFVKGVYCPHCRAVIPQTATVCPKCGKPIKSETTYVIPPESPKKKKPSKIASILATAFLVFVVFGIIGSCMNSASKGKKELDEALKQRNSSVSKALATPSPAPTPASSLNSDELRDSAKKLDTEILKICNDAYTDYSYFVNLFSQEGISEIELYNAAEQAKESLQQYNTQINSVKELETEACSNYKDSAILYVYSMLDVAKKTIKYLDDPTTDNLAKVQSVTEDVNNYVYVVAANRVTFLSDSGFSDDEVNEIVDSFVGNE